MTVSPTLMRVVAKKLNAARDNPPTVMGTLGRLTSLPMLTLVGVVGTAILAMLSRQPGSAMSTHWPVGFACMIIGAALRDVGFARRAARLWPVQSEFIDWVKVNEFDS